MQASHRVQRPKSSIQPAMNQCTDTHVFQNEMDINTIDEPLYTPLDDTIPQIRLANIHFRQPDEADDSMIKCSMKTVSLHEVDSQYFALSYTWGNTNDRKPIIINGHRYMITVNLEAFLREWRNSAFRDQNEGHNYSLWIDAICINQGDLLERNSQVNLMSMIYPSATCTLCWLGGGSDGCEYGLKSISTLGNHVESFLEEEDCANYLRREAWPNGFYLKDKDGIGYFENEAWNGINELFGVGYWDRAWIQQEFVLGKDVALWYGKVLLPLRYARCVLQWLDRIEDLDCPDFFNRGLWSRLAQNPFRNLLSIYPPLYRLGNLQAAAGNRTSIDSPPMVFYLLYSALVDVYSTDPKDMLYSLLGMINLGIQPDYRLTVEEIYYRFAEIWISKPHGLIFLLAAGGPCPVPSHHGKSEHCALPSWVPCWKSLKGGVSRIGIDLSEKLNSEPNLGKATVQITGRCLQTSGYIVSKAKWDKSINAENLKLFLATYLHDPTAIKPNSASRRLQLLLRFICADKHPVARKALSFTISLWSEVLDVVRCVGFAFGFRFPYPIVDIVSWMGLQTYGDVAERLLDEPIPPGIDPSEPIIKEDDRHNLHGFESMLGVNLIEHTVFTTIDGDIGWSLRDLREDDVVCKLSGLKAPVILRKVGDSFRFISPCNLTGLSDEDSQFVPTEIRTFDIY